MNTVLQDLDDAVYHELDQFGAILDTVLADQEMGSSVNLDLLRLVELLAQSGRRGQQRHRVVEIEADYQVPDRVLGGAILTLPIQKGSAEPFPVAAGWQSLAGHILRGEVGSIPEVFQRSFLHISKMHAGRMIGVAHLIVDCQRYLCGVSGVAGSA